MGRKGMAIPIVLILATVFGLTTMFIIKNSQHYNRANLTSFAQLQSHFIARAGVEHAMLKIKFLHRELYDAICMSQGRNPLFDFANPISSYNPGPIFLYEEGEFSTAGSNFFTTSFSKNGQFDLINAFIKDIDNSNVGQNSILAMSFNVNDSDPVSALIKDKFTAQYKIGSLSIVANTVEDNDDSTNNAIIEFVIRSVVDIPKTGETWNREIRKTVKISRD